MMIPLVTRGLLCWLLLNTTTQAHTLKHQMQQKVAVTTEMVTMALRWSLLVVWASQSSSYLPHFCKKGFRAA